MSLRFSLAKAAGAVSTWGLRHVAHRPAANLPGKIALAIDPDLLDELRGKCTQGSVITVGTNGKTSTNNLLADAFEAAGRTIICNRTGANLAAGISSALLQQPAAQWGVFECDELWLAHVLPHLRSNYVLLLNLFRDQLDRCGEIDRIQTSIAGALTASPDTVLVYNADDPLCARIADEVPNRTVAFGLSESMGLAQNTVTDAQMCQKCDGMVRYHYRQYGQLGDYFCDQCDFARPTLDFAGRDIAIGPSGVTMEVCGPAGCESVHTPQPTPYAVYNLVASYALCREVGIPTADFQRAQDAFNPRNGRLQRYRLGGRDVLLNLAKNPTGFNQNLKIVEADRGPKMVAFFINDKEADGRDVSWLWDIDFEELAQAGPLTAYAGGIRGRDMAVRLKYAGIDAQTVDNADDLLHRIAQQPREVSAYIIANYTSLPGCKAALDAAVAAGGEVEPATGEAPAPRDFGTQGADGAPAGEDAANGQNPVVIAHLFPDLLNLYGDGGNVRVLQQRLAWRGIPVEVRRVNHGDAIDLSGVDLIMMGGSPDREQKLASADIVAMRDQLDAYVQDMGPLLAICGSYQMLGREWLVDGEKVPGLGLVGMTTGRPGTSGDRLVSNIALRSPLADEPVVGYENHAGRTYLDEGVEPFGTVVSNTGLGNNEETKQDGVRYKNVLGTYLHGPLLAKNPQIADWLLARALERNAKRTGQPLVELAPLDDASEKAANVFMCDKLGAK